MMRFDLRVRLPEFFTLLYKDAVWRYPATEKVVYLTFDDGPIPEVTPWVLDVLRKESIRATFFCVGENVMRYPEVYRQVLADGHSVGNHTYNHWQGLKKDNSEYLANVEMAGRYINSDLFRPPHGLLKGKQYKQLKEKYQIIMWDLVSCDYDSRINPDQVFQNIREYVRPGSIITFHDSIKAKNNLMKTLLPSIQWLKKEGFRFEVIPYHKK